MAEPKKKKEKKPLSKAGIALLGMINPIGGIAQAIKRAKYYKKKKKEAAAAKKAAEREETIAEAVKRANSSK